ncbi:hypothetical protein ACHWQZ_G017200 [Mnemiopsis leidyi]
MSGNDASALQRQSTKYTLTQGMRNNEQSKKLQAAISSTNGQRDPVDPKKVLLTNKNNESSSASEEETSEKTITNAERYRTRKCLIVHDPFLKHFDADRFSQWFDVTSVQYNSISDILNKGSLTSKINALSPEVVYLHIGFGDLLNKTEGDSITDMYKQLTYKLLESTKAKICISLMIPVLGYPKTNSTLKQINKIVSDFITQLRNQPKYGKRIFTSNNDALGELNAQVTTFIMNDNHLQKRMSILSWNVHDITDKILGHKTISEEFCQVLKQGLIFCLQETKTEVQLPEYLCFNKLRPKSRSGGLCIGVHRSISHNVQRVPCEHEDILAVSIPSSVTRLAKDVVLINVYDSPPNSSYKCKQAAAGEDVNVIDQLINFTAELENRAIILSGDFNARTGELNTEIIHDPSENFGPRAHQSRPSYINTRVSKDAILNERGRKLLEMLESCNLTILNGSTIGDVTGELTSYQYNGASVVDYIATSPDVLDNVDNFRVISLTQFSDHRPLICTLKHNCFQYSSETLVQKYQDIPESVKWNSEISGKTFQDAQDSPGFQNKISEMLLQECHTAEDVIKLNLNITSTLVEIGKMSGKEPRPSSRSKRKMKSKNKWFDASCIFLKRDLRSLTKRYSKDPTNSSLRLRYYSKKKRVSVTYQDEKISVFQRNQ